MTHEQIGPPAPGTTELEIDGRIHVYSPQTQELVALNETAGDVWRLCDGEHTPQQVVDLLAASYGVPAEVLRADVHAALRDFASLGLLAGDR